MLTLSRSETSSLVVDSTVTNMSTSSCCNTFCLVSSPADRLLFDTVSYFNMNCILGLDKQDAVPSSHTRL